MHNYASAITGRLPLVLLLTSLSGCNWVDSTGVQGPTVAVSLRNAEAVTLVEGVALTASLTGEGAELTGWTWEPDDFDAQNHCAAFSDFDAQLSFTSLDDACSDQGNCTFAIDETSSESNATAFTLQMPPLRAPVALSYRLSVNREDGATVERQQLICGLSVNEAPSAVDDQYLAIPGEVLIVEAGSSNSLLANDSDDDDVRNSQLTVSSILTQPVHAIQFSFDADGGFLYQPSADIALDSNGFIEDKIEYTVSDGVHQSRATAIIRIAQDNDAPQQLQSIPDIFLTATTGIDIASPEIQLVDMSRYFSDPDGDNLTFSIADDELPVSGSITISSAGLLQADPTLSDIGRYQPEIVVSDGLESISDTFLLTITVINANRDNSDPVAQDISNRIVSDQFEYDVSRFFSDPDDDVLEFSAEGLPEDVEIDSDGLITGQATRNNQGRWLVRVHASDGYGGTVSDAFALNIR